MPLIAPFWYAFLVGMAVIFQRQTQWMTRFSVVTIFLIGMFVRFGVAVPFSDDINPRVTGIPISHDQLVEYYVAIVISYVMLMAGFWVAKRVPSPAWVPRRCPSMTSPWALGVIAAMLVLIVVAVWVVRPWQEFIGAYPGILAGGHTSVDYRAHRLAYGALTLPSTSLINYAGTIARFGLIPAVLWILWFQRKQNWVNLALFWLAFCLLAVIGFVSGEKSPLLLLLLGFLVVFLLRPQSRLFDWHVIGAAAAGALILLPILYHLQYPNESYFDLFRGQINRLMLEYSRTGQLRFIFYPDQQPFLLGRSSLGIGHILRFVGIDTGNFQAPESYIPEHVPGVGRSYGGTWNTGFMPEAWADFGWAGVILSSVAVGVLVVLAKRWFDEGRRGPLQLGTYTALCLSALYLTDVRLTTALWTFGGALSFAIYLVLCRFPERPKKSEGEVASPPSSGMVLSPSLKPR